MPTKISERNMTKDPRIIVALDYPAARPAEDFVAKVDPGHCKLKVGKELFTAAGPDFVRGLVKRGFQVFLDLKFHDIPNTVAKAVAVAADLGVWMTDVHACGGRRMMEAAREQLVNRGSDMLLIAVTVLTSMEQSDLREIGIDATPQQQVKKLAQLAAQSGMDGVVSSAQEVALLRAEMGKQFVLVTPGIRPAGVGGGDDQRRVVTPSEALALGSHYLVIGRPVTKAEDPVRALLEINRQIAG